MQTEQLQHSLGMSSERLELVIRVFRQRIFHQLDFLKLMLPNNPTHILAVRSSLAAKARCVGRKRDGQAGSVEHVREDGKPAVRFRVTDGRVGVPVNYVGVLPDLFREGQGVVTMGTLRPDGSFLASEVLAKHDATYMPKDVEEALKK